MPAASQPAARPTPTPVPPLKGGGEEDRPPASRVAVDSAPVTLEIDETASRPAALAVVEQTVRARPAVVLAAAAGLGFVAGWLIKR